MTTDISNKIETIVNALLQVSDSVVEVSRDMVLTQVWNAPGKHTGALDSYRGKHIRDIRNDLIFSQAAERVEDSFETGKNHYFEYKVPVFNTHATFSIRIVAIHPDPSYVFVVIKNLSKKEGDELAEDKWKLALDATGDGMWDANLKTGSIFFSDKWREIFGYGPDEIMIAADWTARIHPDDLQESQKNLSDHIEGHVPAYSAEVRFQCKDGTYKWILSRGVVVARDSDGTVTRIIGTHTDINERKIAEAQYHESSQLWSKLLDSLKDGIIVTEQDGNVLFANQAFCDIYKIGLPPAKVIGTNAIEGLKIRSQFFMESEEFLVKSLEMLVSGDMILNEEWEMKDGQILSRDFIPVHLNNDRRIGIWKLRDITDLKHTERRFAAQRNFYEQILNNIASHVVVWDADRRYLFLNPVAVKNQEIRQWLIGKNDFEYCRYRNRSISIAERRHQLFDEIEETKTTVEWVEKLETPAGKIEHHLRTLTPVYNDKGELYIWIGYGMDITDRVLAQEELRTSQETFASAFNYSGIGIALINNRGRWIDVNEMICDMLGYTKEELLAKTPNEVTYEEDKRIDDEQIAKMLRQELSTYTIEKRYVSKQQKIILVSLTVSLVWNSDGTPRFFIAQVLDITRKKELENEINRKNTELEATRVSLINKINQLEELSHIIAHNLRGPAANINMLAEALIAENEGGAAADANPLSGAFTQNEALGFIHDSSTSLMSSLHTLMEIAEIKLNKEVPYDDCDVSRMIHDIMAQLHGVIYEKQAVIKTDLEVTRISYPRAYMESILYNFISNALKYTNADVAPQITVMTRLADGRPQVIVKDNGIGIDMERYGDKMFKLNEVFHQGYDSKGVGLYITKTQVESFGGSIEVRSAPNEGAEFIVTL